MTLRNRIRQRVDEKYIGIAKQEMASPIVDITLEEVEKLIDEKLSLIKRSSVYAEGMSILLEELKEELNAKI